MSKLSELKQDLAEQQEVLEDTTGIYDAETKRFAKIAIKSIEEEIEALEKMPVVSKQTPKDKKEIKKIVQEKYKALKKAKTVEKVANVVYKKKTAKKVEEKPKSRYSKALDKKRKAKPEGWRYKLKNKDNPKYYKRPTSEEIKKKSKRIYLERRKSKSDNNQSKKI